MCALTGALGRRTKYQQTDVAQLQLSVSTDHSHSPEVGVAADLPREISIDDDTLLDKVSFVVSQSQETLSAVQQAVLLGLW